ncbi:MAG: hypothetical protein H6712_33830 [Myxococcales bacterium]|nr:hypothetical protein [Myxococcales bacterium]MCB9718873.1 hypothetical protein [Myxococcales bacterium]
MLAARTAFALLLASTIATGCDAFDGEGIGPEGGVVVSEDGRMSLEVPAGALDETVEITIEVVQGPEGAASDMYVLEPVGLVLARPAAVVFDYDDQALAGDDAEALTIVAKHEADWAYLADQRVDTEDQTVSASVMALSGVTVVVD